MAKRVKWLLLNWGSVLAWQFLPTLELPLSHFTACCQPARPFHAPSSSGERPRPRVTATRRGGPHVQTACRRLEPWCVLGRTKLQSSLVRRPESVSALLYSGHAPLGPTHGAAVPSANEASIGAQRVMAAMDVTGGKK